MKNVINKPNLNQILKSKLGCKELKSIHTSPYYLHHLKNNVLATIHQLGPVTFFVTFTSAKSKWINLVETLHELKYFHNISSPNIQHEYKNIYELFRGDPITCA